MLQLEISRNTFTTQPKCQPSLKIRGRFIFTINIIGRSILPQLERQINPYYIGDSSPSAASAGTRIHTPKVVGQS